MVSKIQEAIKEFLSFTKTETGTPDIYETLKPYTISKTPEASIRAALQKLWKAGEIKKYYIKDDVRYDYPIDPDVKVSSKLPREYQAIKEIFWRKVISDVIYCGAGQVRKEKIDVKMFTFENNRDDQEEFLKNELLEYLQINYPDCFYEITGWVGSDYVKNTKALDQYSYDDSQEWKEENITFVFPETDVEIG